MIKIDLATLFPDMCDTVLSESIVGRARKAGHLDIKCWQIRDYTVDKHRNVDDTPYGPGIPKRPVRLGWADRIRPGPGMVCQYLQGRERGRTGCCRILRNG